MRAQAELQARLKPGRARVEPSAGRLASVQQQSQGVDLRPGCFTHARDLVARDALRGRWVDPEPEGASAVRSAQESISGVPLGAQYWNLSCPLEQSPWSCAWLGLPRAASLAARRYEPDGCRLHGDESFEFGLAHEVLGKLRGRHAVFLGDSVMGQLFVAFGCRLMRTLQVRRMRCEGMLCGPEEPDSPTSALKEGSFVRWLYLPSIDGHPMYAPRCYHGRCAESVGANGQIDAARLVFGGARVGNASGGGAGGQARPTAISSRKSAFDLAGDLKKAIREEGLTRDDVVFVNTGVWFSFGAERELENAMRGLVDFVRAAPPGSIPQVVWLEASAQHWNTPGGVYNVSHDYDAAKARADMPLASGGLPAKSACGRWPREAMARADFRNDLPTRLMKEAGVPVLPIWELTADAADAMPYELPDCSHFCQPGVPDAIAQVAMNYLLYPPPTKAKLIAAYTRERDGLPADARVSQAASGQAIAAAAAKPAATGMDMAELEEDGGMLLIAVLSAVAMWVLVVRLRKQRARARRKRAAV